MSSQNNKMHFDFLDGLRFMAAFWVAVCHFGAPPINLLLQTVLSEQHAMKLQGMFGSMFNGTMAVIVFFIISGFCIHLSYASNRRPLEISSFYCARFLRICLPMLCAIGISLLLPGGFEELKKVLWSLYAEMIYYAFYPAILAAIRRAGIYRPFALCLIVSFTISSIPDAHKGYFWTYGVAGTAVLGLPVWLLGCMLAEKVTQPNQLAFFKSRAICQGFRCTVLAIAALTTHLHYNTFFHFKLSMLVVAPLCAVWLYSEFLQEKSFILFRFFSKAGQAAYSMYLMHMLALLSLPFLVIQTNSLYRTPALLCIALVLTYAFYVIVERPAHRLALSARKWMKRKEEKTSTPLPV
jgi:peptidoglycan/LPS O-acetylase OafA/YrhL